MIGDFLWVLLALTWVFGAVLLWQRRAKARDAIALQRREMLHRERLAAIEKGASLPELPDHELPEWLMAEASRLRLLWLVRFALAVGILALTSGLGITLAFYWSPDEGFRTMWTLGLIPILVGGGCLIYYGVANSWDSTE